MRDDSEGSIWRLDDGMFRGRAKSHTESTEILTSWEPGSLSVDIPLNFSFIIGVYGTDLDVLGQINACFE